MKWLAYVGKDDLNNLELEFGPISNLWRESGHYEVNIIPNAGVYYRQNHVKVTASSGSNLWHGMKDNNIYEDKHKALEYLFTELFK